MSWSLVNLPRKDVEVACWLWMLIGDIQHQSFADILDHIQAGDLLVFNNTKVIPARIFGKKETGGNIELLIERITGSQTALAHIRASKSPKAGANLLFDNGFSAEMLGRTGDLFELKFSAPLLAMLDEIGHMPLPPYIDRDQYRGAMAYGRSHPALQEVAH